MNRLDPEHIYQLGFNREWRQWIDLLHEHRGVLDKDEPVWGAIQRTLDGFFMESWEKMESDMLIDALERLHVLHLGRAISLSSEQEARLIVFLVEWYRERDLRKAYNMARVRPDLDVCRVIINTFEEGEAPEGVEPDRGPKPVRGSDFATSLFKSKQEEDFFQAVRMIFPTYAVYPNVALSAVFDFEGLKAHLSNHEIGYFFRAVIDCVVFDQHRRYHPCYFFELDSAYHEDKRRKTKDKMKDRIFECAGVKLYRVRKIDSKSSGPSSFIPILKEIMEW